ncbi:MAG: hypothetical protein FJ096_07045 [Deltaproteobacteria bacterium]|nr:hypothetical protein [Deltaproteobacteria bacterium]
MLSPRLTSRLARGLTLVALLMSVLSVAGSLPALAGPPAAPAASVPPAKTEPRPEPAHPFTLERLRLSGVVGEGPLAFELSGSVLADGAVDIPLLGPPGSVRLEIEGKEPIGFDRAYFLHTRERRFLIKGKLWLGPSQTLEIPGPLNTLETRLTGGKLAEGDTLTGLTGATLHFVRQASGDAAQVEEPTVFQLARAVRVGKEIAFEYRLELKSGDDLGLVRLPLAHGEEVLEVTGAPNSRVDGRELVIPTSGKQASVRITGRLPTLGTFAPDARSPYEWWLFEGDPEHRVSVEGSGSQVDVAESPIPRVQASARLFLVKKGQSVTARVDTLKSVEVLAAVLRSHERMVVLTDQGDAVLDDAFHYENNGIDYVRFDSGARPIFLATDGTAERLLRESDTTNELLIPLRSGSHGVHVQAVGGVTFPGLGGFLTVPVPSYPLTASRVRVTVGVGDSVVPLALLGGDRLDLHRSAEDGVGVLASALFGGLAVRIPAGARRRRSLGLRLVGAVALGGLALVSPGLALLAWVILGTLAVSLRLALYLRGGKLIAALVLLGGAAGFVALGVLAMGFDRSPGRKASSAQVEVSAARTAESVEGGSGVRAKAEEGSLGRPAAPASGSRYGIEAKGNLAQDGNLTGVTPVALSLPRYKEAVSASRELVTRDRPFAPRLVYVKRSALAPLWLLWVGSLGAALLLHRGFLSERWAALRAALAHGFVPPVVSPPPPAGTTEGDPEAPAG